MPGTAPRTVYLVQRWDWRVREDDTEEVGPDDPRPDGRPHPYQHGARQIVTYQRGPDEGGMPVRAFRDYAKAEAFRRQQETARRAATNPFRYGHGTEGRTSLDDDRLRDWLLDAGLTPPGRQGEEEPEMIGLCWQVWWESQRDRLAPKQQAAVCRALHQVLGGREEDAPEAPEAALAWVEGLIGRVGELTAQQRSLIRMGLLGRPWTAYPELEGERDHYAVESKWRDWWDENHPAMSDYQRQMVWEALDKVRFFEVVELEEGE